MLAALPEEVLVVLARRGCARLALLCRRFAHFFARPEVRWEAAPPYYFALNNRGKYRVLERLLQAPEGSAGDAVYRALLPYLSSATADEREVRRLAAAAAAAPAARAATARVAEIFTAHPQIWMPHLFRLDLIELLQVTGGAVENAAKTVVQKGYSELFSVRGAGPARCSSLYFWSIPAKVREMRATGAPLSFSMPGPVCRCRNFPVFLAAAEQASCPCLGTSHLVREIERAMVTGAGSEIAAALAEAARPLPPEHGGDGSEEALDPNDAETRELVKRVFASVPEVQRLLEELPSLPASSTAPSTPAPSTPDV